MDATPSSISIKSFRENVGRRALPVLVICLWLLASTNLWRGAIIGVTWLPAAQLIICILTTALWLGRRFLAPNFVNLLIVGVFLLLFLLGIPALGLLSSGMVVPPVAAIFLVLLGYRRASLATIALCAIYLLVVGYLFVTGVLKPIADPNTFITSPVEWILAALVPTALAFIFVIPFQWVPDAIDSSTERFRVAFENANEGVCLLDTEGRFLDVNQTFCDMLGYPREELLSKNFNEVTHPDDFKIGENFVGGALGGKEEKQSFEKRYLRKDGSIVWGQVSSSLVRAKSGRARYFVSHVQDVTARKQMEGALRESEEKFSKLFMATPAGVSLSTLEEGRLLEVNREFEKILGYSREEIIGRTSFDLGLWMEAGDREAFIRGAGQAGGIGEADLLIRTRSGSVLTLRSTAQMVEIGGKTLLLSAFADITQTKRAQEALRESEARYRALVENTPDIIARFDRNLRYLFVNSAVKSVSRLTPKEFLGKTLGDVGFTPSQAEERNLLITKVIETRKGAEAELEFTSPGGLRTYEWRAYPEFDPAGEVQSVLAINRDITERKLGEIHLRRSMEQLHALTRRLEQVREEERKAVSHEVHDELGQILTALRMDLMSLRSIDPADSIEYGEKTKALLDLTDNAIGVVQDVAAKLRPGMLDYLGLLAAMEWQVEDFQRRSGVICHLELPDREPAVDSERSTALFRILQEALTNVARHAKAHSVTVRFEEQDTELLLRVADDGVGVSPAKIQDPLSFGILGMQERLHPFGGSCTIESPTGHGTVVTVHLPKEKGRA